MLAVFLPASTPPGSIPPPVPSLRNRPASSYARFSSYEATATGSGCAGVQFVSRGWGRTLADPSLQVRVRIRAPIGQRRRWRRLQPKPRHAPSATSSRRPRAVSGRTSDPSGHYRGTGRERSHSCCAPDRWTLATAMQPPAPSGTSRTPRASTWTQRSSPSTPSRSRAPRGPSYAAGEPTARDPTHAAPSCCATPPRPRPRRRRLTSSGKSPQPRSSSCLTTCAPASRPTRPRSHTGHCGARSCASSAMRLPGAGKGDPTYRP